MRRWTELKVMHVGRLWKTQRKDEEKRKEEKKGGLEGLSEGHLKAEKMGLDQGYRGRLWKV